MIKDESVRLAVVEIASALDVLRQVDGVGREMKWSCNGYCGKKQPMVVSVGGPALRTRAHLGGQ